MKLLSGPSTEDRARARLEDARLSPGFSDHPDNFDVSRYTMNRDERPEGFVTVMPPDDLVP
jgi:hypothetical protein